MINLFIKKMVFLIKENVAQGVLPVTFLMETLSISKETAYRRLRGEMLFSFDEMIKISKKLGVSLDEIADMDEWEDKSNWVKFDLGWLNQPSSNSYFENVKKFTDMFSEMSVPGNTSFRCATLAIPFDFVVNYEKLSLFRYYKWSYLTHGIDRGFSFDKITISESSVDVKKQFIDTLKKTEKFLYVIDQNIFLNTIIDINYFFNEHLISQTELLELKAELLDLVSFMESLTETGAFENGGLVDIYLADVSIDSTYLHIENASAEFAVNVNYFVDVIVYKNKTMCERQKNWIDLLKRFSTLITQTGEKTRFEFFNNQREMIKNLL